MMTDSTNTKKEQQKIKKIRIGVLASGSGTDLQSIIDAIDDELLDGTLVIVLSDNKDAYALKRAEKHNIETMFLDPKKKNRKTYDKEITEIMQEYQVDLIIGAGYMRLFSKEFVDYWFGRLINIHPALLPSFKGIHGQSDALDYGVKITGCTTHFIDDQIDHGPIILQAAVKVKETDTVDSLKERILKVEHQTLPRTIQLFAENRLHIKGRRVQIDPGSSWKQKIDILPDVLYPDAF